MATTVLIVDDHEGFRKWSRVMLELDGFEIVGEVANGAEAFAAAASLLPDVVLLDVMLPDKSGFEVAEELAALETVPAVILTSSREAADYGRLVDDSPARGFVPKQLLSAESLAALLGTAV